MDASKIKRVDTPVSLSRDKAVGAAERRIVRGVTGTTSPPGAGTALVACTNWTQVTLVCRCTIGASYSIRLWWFYASASLWVRDRAFGVKTVPLEEPAAFVVSTGAASGIYVEVYASEDDAVADIWAEADK